MIDRRLVFLFPGFEPMGAEAHIARFRRAAGRSAPHFDAELHIGDEAPPGEVSRPQAASDRRLLTLDARLETREGTTETEIVFCDWGDLIADYAKRGAAERFFAGYAALADFLVTGTAFRYCRVSWRYSLFFAFPILIAALSVALAALAAKIVAGFAGIAAAVLTGVLVGVALIVLAARRLHLLTALDDWRMARDFCRDRNADLRMRIDEQARAIERLASASAAGEIVVAAHSLGASLAVLALSRAIANGFRPDGRLTILTVGSSLLKTALHPAATAQRMAVRNIVVDHEIPWTDCQALLDPINFYKSNPATSLGIVEGRRPLVRRVHFRRLLTEATYRRIKRDFFRLHRQFVLAVERRAPYSFHMLLLGPHPLREFAMPGKVDSAEADRDETPHLRGNQAAE